MIEVNKIYNENCLDTMAKMPDGFIDLVVTSPPYDDLRNYKGYSFEFEPIARELFRTIKEGGVLVWIVADSTKQGSESCTSFKQALYFKECGFSLYDTMIYQKNGITSPQKPEIRYNHSFEYMFVFCKGQRPKTIKLVCKENKVEKGKRYTASKRQRDGSLLKYNFKRREKSPLPNVWLIDAVNGTKESRKHSAPFPEILPERHVYSWSKEGDLVYDPFMGSGTTAKVAHLQKRNWLGSEISKEYVELAEKRLEPYLSQLTIF